MAALESEPLARWSPELHEQLKALHPEGPELPPVSEDAAPAPVINEETLGAVLRALKPGKAAGPSGMTYEHVKAAVTGSDEALSVLLDIINLILSGSLPRCAVLTDSRLVAIIKPSGGVRPIAIGEVVLRIASLCALAAVDGAGAALAPTQLGVGVSGGAEAMGHALRAAIDAEPDAVIVQIDYENAFNRPLRSEIVAATRVRTPSLERFVTWLYGQHSRLLVEGAPPEIGPILSQRGVRQGDPLGPLLFNNLLQGPLEEAVQAGPSTKCCAVHDDAALHGAPADVEASFLKLQELTEPLGMRIRRDKTAAYSRNAAAAAQTAQRLGVRHATDGIVTAGSPIGDAEFVRQFVEQRTGAVRAAVRRLRELEGHLSAQDAFLLLRLSLSSKLTYLQRVVPVPAQPAANDPILAAHRAAALDIAAAALAFARLEGSAALPAGAIEQLQAPLRDGGFGLYSCCANTLGAAYLSSAALAQRALQEAPAALQPFQGPSRAGLVSIWQRLRTGHESLAALASDEPDSAAITGELPGVQHKLARLLADAAATAALDAATPTQEALLRSASCHAASAWLTAKPVCPRLVLANSAFRAAVRRRLCMSAMPNAAPHARCGCGKPVAELGPEHALNCKCVWTLVIKRHDDIARAVLRAVTRAGWCGFLEPHLSEYGGNPTAAQLARRCARAVDDSVDEARADLLCADDEGQRAMVDVSCINVLSRACMRAAAASDGAAAAMRDEQKRAKYAARGDSGYNFTPFSVETSGRLGKPAVAFITKLGRKAAIASKGAFSSRQFVEGVLQEISVILSFYHARMESAVSSLIVRPAGREWLRPREVPSCDVGDSQ
jgi:hypothetical protein